DAAIGTSAAVATDAVENGIRVGFFENLNRNVILEQPQNHSRRNGPARRQTETVQWAAGALLNRARASSATQSERRTAASEGQPLPGVLQPGGHAVDGEEHEAADPLVGLLIGAVGAAKYPQGPKLQQREGVDVGASQLHRTAEHPVPGEQAFLAGDLHDPFAGEREFFKHELRKV